MPLWLIITLAVLAMLLLTLVGLGLWAYARVSIANETELWGDENVPLNEDS